MGDDLAITPEEFWSLIALPAGDPRNIDRYEPTLLIDALVKKSIDEIEAFYDHLALRLRALDTRQHYRICLWKSLFFVQADSFLYARLAVVARGQAYYEMVLNHPARFPSASTHSNEALLWVVPQAYELKTGEEFNRLPVVDFETFQNPDGWQR